MTDSIIEKFSRLKHRGSVPDILFEEIMPYCEQAAIFLVKDGKLCGWDSLNIPLLSEENKIRQVTLKIQEEPDIFSSLIAGRTTQFKVPDRWKEYGLIEANAQEQFCLAFPFKYGKRLFGSLLCFKHTRFSNSDRDKLKEVSLCAAEFSVILPPPSFPDQDQMPPVQEAFLQNSPSRSEALSPEEVIEEDNDVLRARLLAKLLVNNIKLYNEEKVILGRMKKDLRSRLRKEIEEARKFYNARVPEEIRKREDFFENELIANLAAGNVSALT